MPFLNRLQVPASRLALRAPVLALTLLLAHPSAPGLADFRNAQFTSQEFLEPIKFLSSDKLKGRGDGTKELDEAAHYIEKRFKKFGLKPAGDGVGYMQRFKITVGARMGGKNSVTYRNGGTRGTLKAGQDFVPLSFSKDATVEAPLVFAGYGITAPEYNYDDYKGLDAKGKVVLVLRHEPQENDEKSVFAGKQLTTHSEVVNKAINARNHGAVGMILVNDLGNHPGEPDELIKFGTLTGPEEVEVASLHVKAGVVDDWLKSTGKSLEELREAIDKDLSNHSFALDPAATVAISVDIQRVRKEVSNVIGVLPGRTAAAQCVVVGAHYDHLGLGDQHSLAPSQVGQIHHGADDNASGTSGLLEIADAFAHAGKPPAHTLVFVSFAGEETGLLGSSYYTTHPACALDRTLAMVNMDMIGRVSKNKLYVGGTGTSPGFKKLVEDANHDLGFTLSYSASGYGASDHMSFTVQSVPVLFFFSGLHSDYHKPSDTWDKINADDGAKVTRLVAGVVDELDQLTEKPQFVRVAEPTPSAMGGGGGYGPYFGSIPDFGEVEHGGVKFADVRDNSPAAKAGFKAGDTLIDFDGKKIDNLYDFTYSLRAHKPGDKVPVTVLRKGEKITRDVTLEVRK